MSITTTAAPPAADEPPDNPGGIAQEVNVCATHLPSRPRFLRRRRCTAVGCRQMWPCGPATDLEAANLLRWLKP